ncbi:hypothetical protein AAEH73_15805, partial [Shewanella algae]|uniref:hypothetical protein n=1 Tax=Shewanella algae TaxID=38313 RepID=UPI00313B3379
FAGLGVNFLNWLTPLGGQNYEGILQCPNLFSITDFIKKYYLSYGCGDFVECKPKVRVHVRRESSVGR